MDNTINNKMVDSFGKELKIGDNVIFAITDSYCGVTRFKGNYFIGTILDFKKGFLEIRHIDALDDNITRKRCKSVIKFFNNIDSYIK